jgi:hypothetical protein
MKTHSSGVLKYNKKQSNEDNRRTKLLKLKTSKFYTMESCDPLVQGLDYDA